MNIRKTFETIERLRNMIDSHVWDTFRKYRDEFGILFNYPESWLPSDDGKGIHFEGQDGCRGCYDNMALDIPYEFFEDYEKAAAKCDAVSRGLGVAGLNQAIRDF